MVGVANIKSKGIVENNKMKATSGSNPYAVAAPNIGFSLPSVDLDFLKNYDMFA